MPRKYFRLRVFALVAALPFSTDRGGRVIREFRGAQEIKWAVANGHSNTRTAYTWTQLTYPSFHHVRAEYTSTKLVFAGRSLIDFTRVLPSEQQTDEQN